MALVTTLPVATKGYLVSSAYYALSVATMGYLQPGTILETGSGVRRLQRHRAQLVRDPLLAQKYREDDEALAVAIASILYGPLDK